MSSTPSENPSSRALNPTAAAPVSLRAIADRVGVSRMTVSRALRGDPLLSDHTVERVRQAALALGYRANPRISALMAEIRRGRGVPARESLAWINTFPPSHDEPLSPTERRMLHGARSRATELGSPIEVFDVVAHAGAVARLADAVWHRGHSGVIVQASRGSFAGLEKFAQRLPACVVGCAQPLLPLHAVSNHHADTMSLALDELARRGYRRIGLYLNEPVDDAMGHAWHATFVGRQHLQHRVEPGLVYLTPDWNESAFGSWLRTVRPDAVLTIHAPALPWMRAAGVAVPEDTAFVHLDWTPEAGNCTGIDQRTEEEGAAAVDLVLHAARARERGEPASPQAHLIRSRWREGPTVRPK